MDPSASSGQVKLVLIDGNAIMHRAYHALPPLTTRGGEPINAVYGLVSMLLKIITDFKPTHIAVAFDRKEPTFRHKEFKAYQAHRPEMDRELSSQFEKAQAVFEAMKIPVYSKAGFEADDIIGTISLQITSHHLPVGRQGKSLITDVVIVTGDRDILQLVDERVGVYLPTKGLSEGKVYDRSGVVEKMGVTPERIVDYKALVGDQSDNYPGVPGIGPRTAERLLAKYKRFENIYKYLDDVKESVRKKLINGRKSGELSLKLARIVRNVPIEFSADEMSRWQLDGQNVLETFAEFGFMTLTRRAEEVGERFKKEKQMELI